MASLRMLYFSDLDLNSPPNGITTNVVLQWRFLKFSRFNLWNVIILETMRAKNCGLWLYIDICHDTMASWHHDTMTSWHHDTMASLLMFILCDLTNFKLNILGMMNTRVKMHAMTCIEVDICNRMASLPILFSVTFTNFFSVKHSKC